MESINMQNILYDVFPRLLRCLARRQQLQQKHDTTTMITTTTMAVTNTPTMIPIVLLEVEKN